MMQKFKHNDFLILEVLARAEMALKPSEICERAGNLPLELGAKTLQRSSLYFSLKRLVPKYVRKIPQHTFPREVKYAITKSGQELLTTLEANFLLQKNEPPGKDDFIFTYAKPIEGKSNVVSIWFPERLQPNLARMCRSDEKAKQTVGRFLSETLDFYLTRESRIHTPLTIELVKPSDDMILLKRSTFKHCSLDEIADALGGSNFEERLFLREITRLTEEKLKRGFGYFLDEAADVVARLIDFDHTSLPKTFEIEDESVEVYVTIAARTFLKPILKRIYAIEMQQETASVQSIAGELCIEEETVRAHQTDRQNINGTYGRCYDN